MTIRLVRLTGQDARIWLPAALDVYVTAMGYPLGTERHRHPLWQEHIGRTGWSAFGALVSLDATGDVAPGMAPAVPTQAVSVQTVSANPVSTQSGILSTGTLRAHSAQRIVAPPVGNGREALVGIAYGYRGAAHQWWNQQLRQGLRRTGHPHAAIDKLTSDYFELTELHVHPDAQGQGIGQWLLSRLLADRTERRVLLSTPEIADEGNRAWSLYRRLGFVDVLRHFTFTGDPRPFAFLGRQLPLTPPPESATMAEQPPLQAR